MTRGAVGTIYMIHFARPYKHARHYVGWSPDLEGRLAAHKDGRGARLMAVVVAAGIEWELARTRQGTRDIERKIKRDGGASRYCPVCRADPWGGWWIDETRHIKPG